MITSKNKTQTRKQCGTTLSHKDFFAFFSAKSSEFQREILQTYLVIICTYQSSQH